MPDDNKTKPMIGGKVVAQWETKTEENTCTSSIYSRNGYYNDIVERHEIEDGRISKEGLGTTILDSSIPIRYREEKNGD